MIYFGSCFGWEKLLLRIRAIRQETRGIHTRFVKVVRVMVVVGVVEMVVGVVGWVGMVYLVVPS